MSLAHSSRATLFSNYLHQGKDKASPQQGAAGFFRSVVLNEVTSAVEKFVQGSHFYN